MKNIDKVFDFLGNNDGKYERRYTFLSFGNKESVKENFIECINKYDLTIKKFLWLPEYNEIIDWLVDNKGQGLYLTGDCGRGKTNIILGVVVPLFLLNLNKRIPGFHASKLSDKVPVQFEDRYRWNYEFIKDKKIAYIDELGTERMIPYYGEKFEPFNEILNEAEQKLNILIISSNLSGDQFLERYGDRTMDRIKRLCKIVHFKGESLRR